MQSKIRRTIKKRWFQGGDTLKRGNTLLRGGIQVTRGAQESRGGIYSREEEQRSIRSDTRERGGTYHLEGMHTIIKSVDIHTVNRRNIRPRLGTRRRQIPQNREQEEEEGHQTRWIGCKTSFQDKGPAIKELRPPRRRPRRRPKNRAFSCCKREHFSYKARVRRQGQEGDTLSRGGYTVKRGIHCQEGIRCQEGGYTKRRKHCREEEVTKRKYLPRRGMFEEEGHTQEARNVGHTAKQRDSRHDEHPTQAIPARPSKRWNRSMIKYLSINSGTHPPALCREREQSEGHAVSHDEDSMTSYRDPEMSRDR